jgi:hypothetical protein
MRRLLLAPVGAALCALVLVWGATSEPAYAQAQTVIEQAPVVIPVAAGAATAGTGVVVTSAGGACATGVLCPLVLTLVGGAALYYGGNKLLDWAFGVDHEPEEPTTITPSTTSTAGGGCWRLVADVTQATAPCAIGQDGVTVTASGKSFTALVVQAVANGSTDGQIKGRFSWAGGPINAGWVEFTRSCTTGLGAQTISMPAQAASAGAYDFQFDGPFCSGNGGVKEVTFKHYAGSFGCCGTVGTYVMPTGTPTYLQPAPDHKLRAEKVCAVPGGGTPTTVTAYSTTFKEADSTLPGMPNPLCPAGTRPSSYTVHEGDETGAGVNPILTWTAPDYDTLVQYSDCLPGGSAAPCTVRLLKVTPNGTIDCARGQVDCTSFDPDTSLETDYQCRWATHVVPLSQCVGVPPSLPDAPPGGDDPFPAPPDADDDVLECIGNVTWNPLSWVFQPVKCVLVWAFVPDDMGGYYDQIEEAAGSTMIAKGATAISNVYQAGSGLIAAADTTNCAGPELGLPLIPGQGDFELRPLDACGGTMATIASTTKTVLSVGVVLGGGFALVSLLLAVWGGPRVQAESTDEHGQGRFVL